MLVRIAKIARWLMAEYCYRGDDWSTIGFLSNSCAACLTTAMSASVVVLLYVGPVIAVRPDWRLKVAHLSAILVWETALFHSVEFKTITKGIDVQNACACSTCSCFVGRPTVAIQLNSTPRRVALFPFSTPLSTSRFLLRNFRATPRTFSPDNPIKA